MRRTFQRAILLCYGAAAVWIFAGFLMHASSDPDLGRYSSAYALFLLASALVLALPLVAPRFAPSLIRRIGPRNAALAAASVAAVCLVAWIALSTWYYTTQEHDFDPFLQAPPRAIEELAAAGPPAGPRVLAMGGSTTRNKRLPFEERYATLLQERLRRVNPETVVVNAGQDWWTSEHSLIHYVTFARRWRPDVVVVLHAINDLCRSFSPAEYAIGGYDPRYAHFYGPSIHGARPPPFYRRVFDRVFGPLGAFWYQSARHREVDHPLSRYVSIDEFGYFLESIVEVVRADGAEVVLVTQPSLYADEMDDGAASALWFPRTLCSTRRGWGQSEYPSSRSMAEAMGAFNDVTRSIAHDRHVLLADVARSMPRTLGYLSDDVHYTARGAAHLAKEVAAVAEPLIDAR